MMTFEVAQRTVEAFETAKRLGLPSCLVLTLGNIDLERFHAGFAAGGEARSAGVVVPPNDFAKQPRWWRFGWSFGQDCARERRSPAEVGRWLRSLGLPIAANPWLRDTPSGLDFEEGWGRRNGVAVAA